MRQKVVKRRMHGCYRLTLTTSNTRSQKSVTKRKKLADGVALYRAELCPDRVHPNRVGCVKHADQHCDDSILRNVQTKPTLRKCYSRNLLLRHNLNDDDRNMPDKS